MTETISTTNVSHAHRALCRYLEKPCEDRLFLLKDARDELGALLSREGALPRADEEPPEASRQGFIQPLQYSPTWPKTLTVRDRIVAVLRRYNKPVRRDLLLREIGGPRASVANSLTALVRSGTVRRKRPSYYELVNRPQAVGHEGVPEVLQSLDPKGLPYRVLEVLLRGGWWNAPGIATAIGAERSGVSCALSRLCDRGFAEKGDERGFYRLAEDAA